MNKEKEGMKKRLTAFFGVGRLLSIAETESTDYAANRTGIIKFSLLRYKQMAFLLGLSVAAAIAFVVAQSAPDADRVLAIMIALMLAALVSSIAGFAFSAIAGIGIYHLAHSPVEAVTIMMCSSIAIQFYSVISMRRSIDWLRLTPFLVGGCLTVVPFSWLILHVSAGFYLFAIGVFLIVYGAYMLLRKPLTLKVSAPTGLALDIVAGGLGGVTGPLAAFPGAAITIWCGMRGWDKVRQRTTYQPYILIMQVIALVLITSMGHSKSFDFAKALYAMPAILGCHIGLLLFQRISTPHFNYLVNALLIISGVAMLVGNQP
jgi:uncharacterized membrane protein YfcA